MIDFRYHIVSIAAIFLALGIGVATGATVLDRATVNTLNHRLDDIKKASDNYRAEIDNMRVQRDRANDLVRALAPRVLQGTLTGSQLLYVYSGADASWHSSVRDALARAGAQSVGSLAMTGKWQLSGRDDQAKLRAAFGAVQLDANDPAGHASRLLGQLLIDDAGADLIAKLAAAGFVTIAPAASGRFPPGLVQVVVFSSITDPLLANVARGAAAQTPTLAVAHSVAELGSLATLRTMTKPPAGLSTFDSAGDDATGIGSVLALRSAVDGQGGNFGRAPGLAFVPSLK